MADIKKELNDIKTAIYGRDVRGSIHDGIDKINKESEDSKQKANEAHDVMESIINDGFDNAALEANFEQKLDDKIGQLQPEWTQFQTDVTSQLNETEDNTFKNNTVNHKGEKSNKDLLAVWIDDDGHKGVYTKLAPLLREYGIKMNSAVITSLNHGFPINGLPGYDPNGRVMSYEEMQELYEEGLVEFISHTHTHDANHRLTDMTVKEMHEELSASQNILRKLGWQYRYLVYPFGSENTQVQDVVSQYFEAAFHIHGGAQTYPMNQFKINRQSIDFGSTSQTVTVNGVKTEIDNAKNGFGLISLTSHVDQYGGLDLSKTREIIEYALSQGFKFVFASEALKSYGNLMQFGNTIVTYDGRVHSKKIGVYQNGVAEYNPNAPITDFPKGTVTRLKLTRPNLGNYQIIQDTRLKDTYGFIEVYRDDTEDGYSFQLCNDVYNGAQIYRKWDNSQSIWEKWKDVSSLVVNHNIPNTANPNEYLKVAEYISKISNANAPNLGLETGGIIKTFKDSEPSYTHQLVIPSKTGNETGIKLRYSNNNHDGWDDWVGSIPLIKTHYHREITTTIPGNGTVDLDLNYASVRRKDFYIANPLSPLPSGVDFHVYSKEDGKIRVRFSNVYASPVTITNLPINIIRIVM